MTSARTLVRFTKTGEAEPAGMVKVHSHSGWEHWIVPTREGVMTYLESLGCTIPNRRSQRQLNAFASEPRRIIGKHGARVRGLSKIWRGRIRILPLTATHRIVTTGGRVRVEALAHDASGNILFVNHDAQITGSLWVDDWKEVIKMVGLTPADLQACDSTQRPSEMSLEEWAARNSQDRIITEWTT